MRLVAIAFGVVLTTAYSVFMVVLFANLGCGGPTPAKQTPPAPNVPEPVREPVYNDRTARQWVEYVRDAKNSPRDNPSAVAALVAIAQHETPRMRAWALTQLGTVGTASPNVLPTLLAGTRDSDSTISTAAADAIVAVGAPGVPFLMETARATIASSAPDRTTTFNCGRALGRIGGSAVEPLLAFLADANDDGVYFAVTGLKHLDAAAIPRLLQAHANGNPKVVKGVEHALWSIPIAAPQLRAALGDGDPGIRRAAARGLAGVSAWADAPPPELRQMLGDPDPKLRVAAIQALARVEPRTGAVFKLLAAARSDPKTEVRVAAVLETRMMKDYPDLEAAMLEAMSDGSPVVRAEAIYGLSTVPALLKALKDPAPEIRSSVVRLLGHEKSSRAVLEGLIPALSDSDYHVQSAAAFTLNDNLKRPSPDVRAALVRVLRAAFESPAQFPLDPDVAEMLPHLKPESLETIPLLVKELADGYRTTAAHGALERFGDDAVPALVKALGDADVTRRRNAASVLLSLAQKPGGNVRGVTEALTKAARDSDTTVRDHATKALDLLKANQEKK